MYMLLNQSFGAKRYFNFVFLRYLILFISWTLGKVNNSKYVNISYSQYFKSMKIFKTRDVKSHF